MLIPAISSSLKSFFVTARDSRKARTLTYFPYRCNKFLIYSYLFCIGAQVLPFKLPDNVPEIFSKAIALIGDLNHQPSFKYSSYTQDISAANAGDLSIALSSEIYGSFRVNSGSFYVGLDL